MRPAAWLLTAALVAAPLGVARAYRIASPPPPPPPPADFWSEALHPNSQRVAELVMQLEAMLRQLDDPYGATDRTRIEMVREGNRLARQARQLDPDDLDALYFSGAFADAAGRALDADDEQTIEGALARVIARVGTDDLKVVRAFLAAFTEELDAVAPAAAAPEPAVRPRTAR